MSKNERIILKLKEATNAQCLRDTALVLTPGATELNVANLYTKMHPTTGVPPACLKVLETAAIADLKTEAANRKASLTTEITNSYKGAAATCDDTCQK